MNTHRTSATRMRAAASSALVAFALALPQVTAGAQTTDPRWTPYLGCWAPVDAGVISISGAGSTENLVCVVPSTKNSSVDVASIVGSKLIARTSVDAGGARNVKTVDDCTGWESAKWSTDGHRVMFRSEFRCANNVTRKESGVFSMTPEGQWLDVQGVDVMGATSTRAVRFREIGVDQATLRSVGAAAIGDTLRVAATGTTSMALQTLRVSTAGRLTPDDALDMSRNVDIQVAEAWLNESGQVFSVDARTLVRLADAGMSPRMIDLLVALSYPKTFAVNPSSRSGGGGSAGSIGNTRISTMSSYGITRSMCDAMYGGYSGMGYYGAFNDCYGSRYGNMYSQYGYGSRYGNGYYYGNQPIIIINRGNIPAAESNRGRAVNGRGYTRSEPLGSTGSSSMDTRSSRGSGSSSGSSSGGSSSGSSSGGESSGSSSSGGRTAKARGGA